MTTHDAAGSEPLELGLRLGGVLLRAGGYWLFATVAGHYDCGPALLTGALAGDVLASLLTSTWRWASDRGQVLGELALLGLAVLLLRNTLTMPDDLAQRAIFGFAAFAVLLGRAGGSAIMHFGPDGRR